MTPTMHLRWRILPGHLKDTQPTLQQWWSPSWNHEKGEWRDVPFSSNVETPPDEWKHPGETVMD